MRDGRPVIPQRKYAMTPSVERLKRSLTRFEGYWRDYDFTDFEDMRRLRDTLQEFVYEAHSAHDELEARGE